MKTLLVLIALIVGYAHACGVTTAAYNATQVLTALAVTRPHTCDDLVGNIASSSSVYPAATVTTAAGDYAYAYIGIVSAGNGATVCHVIMKFSAAGALVWTTAVRFTGEGGTYSQLIDGENSLSLGASENVYLMTDSFGSAWSDRTAQPVATNPSGNQTQIYSVFKFNAVNGSLMWSAFLPHSTQPTISPHLVPDPTNSAQLVIAGSTNAQLDPGLPAVSNTNCALWRMRDSDGALLGVYQWLPGSAIQCTALSLAIDPSDGACIVGGSKALLFAAYAQGYLARMTCGPGQNSTILAVSFVWQKTFGTSSDGTVKVQGVGFDTCSALYIAGTTGAGILGLSAGSFKQGFIAQLDSGGSTVWAKAVIDSAADTALYNLQVLPWGHPVGLARPLPQFYNSSFDYSGSNDPSILTAWDALGNAQGVYGRNGTKSSYPTVYAGYASPRLASVLSLSTQSNGLSTTFQLDLAPVCRSTGLVADPQTQSVTGLGVLPACETGCSIQLALSSNLIDNCTSDQFCAPANPCNITAGCPFCNTSLTCPRCNQTAGCTTCNTTAGCTVCNHTASCPYCNTSSTCAVCDTTAGCTAPAAACVKWSWSFSDAFSNVSAAGFVVGLFFIGLFMGAVLVYGIMRWRANRATKPEYFY